MNRPITSDDLLLLHADDNVLLLKNGLAAGSLITIEGTQVSLPVNLGMGQKVARKTISKGEQILKYGAPIGVAGSIVKTGEHVHLHNLVSQYTVIEDLEE